MILEHETFSGEHFVHWQIKNVEHLFVAGHDASENCYQRLTLVIFIHNDDFLVGPGQLLPLSAYNDQAQRCHVIYETSQISKYPDPMQSSWWNELYDLLNKPKLSTGDWNWFLLSKLLVQGPPNFKTVDMAVDNFDPKQIRQFMLDQGMTAPFPKDMPDLAQTKIILSSLWEVGASVIESKFGGAAQLGSQLQLKNKSIDMQPWHDIFFLHVLENVANAFNKIMMDEMEIADAKTTSPNTTHEVVSHLGEIFPSLAHEIGCPVPQCPERYLLWQIITHLNDYHHWSREQIADWLDTLPDDLTVPALSSGD